MEELELVTIDPGHFHAALVQKEMYPGVSNRVHVYAPPGPDLAAHLGRIAAFNGRTQNPTAWQEEVHAEPDFLHRFAQERPGNVVVLSGRNNIKIDYLEAAIEAGFHVLGDKPWIIRAEDFSRLRAVLDNAKRRGLIAYDIMTERHEITSILQRDLVNDPEVAGDLQAGDPPPFIFMESVHYLLKTVAGVPLRRPPWFFDVHHEGEGLSDVGAHLVDLAMWMAFPNQDIDFETDLRIQGASRWPTMLNREHFQRITGEADFPAKLRANVQDGELAYFCNTSVGYTLRGIPVILTVRWDLESQTGSGDTHLAVYRGRRSFVEIRQGPAENFRPELYVLPVFSQPEVVAAVKAKVKNWQAAYPGLAMVQRGARLWVTIPDEYRVGHEAHFAEVATAFFSYVRDPSLMPAWENPNMLAKYWLTTQGVELARQ